MKLHRYAFVIWYRDKGRDLTQSYGISPYTNINVKMANWQHKNATKNFDYTAIGDRLNVASWMNYKHPTGVVNQFMVITFLLPATAV